MYLLRTLAWKHSSLVFHFSQYILIEIMEIIEIIEIIKIIDHLNSSFSLYLSPELHIILFEADRRII